MAQGGQRRCALLRMGADRESGDTNKFGKTTKIDDAKTTRRSTR